MDGDDVVGVCLLPAIDMIEQFDRRALRAHQGRRTFVRIEQAEQIAWLRAGGGAVIDEEFFALEFGAAVDET
jgi:hypothetical protein